MSDEPRICARCKFFSNERTLSTLAAESRGYELPGPRCTNPRARTVDVVLGGAFCATERNAKAKTACGPKGTLWEKA